MEQHPNDLIQSISDPEHGISKCDPLGAADVDSVIEALAEFPSHRPPQTLFRFFSERAISSLTEGKLKFTPPIEFNDPFEVWAGLSESNLTEESVIRSVLTPGSLFRVAMAANYPEYDLREMDFEKRMADAVKSAPEFHRKHLKSLVDSLAHTCSTSIGVSCFSAFSSEEFQSELGIHHWAMYGDSHKGFAIAYDGEHPQTCAFAETKWLFPVEYVDQRYVVDLAYFDEWNDRKMWRTFRHWLALKARRAWEHEKEWRLIFPIKSPPDSHFVTEIDDQGRSHCFLKLWNNATSQEEQAAHASIISAVFLGARATPELTDQVLEAVSAPHLCHVDVWSMEIDDSLYALVPKQLRAGDTSRVGELRAGLVRQSEGASAQPESRA